MAALGTIFAELKSQDEATVVAKRKGRRYLSSAVIALGVDVGRRTLTRCPLEEQWN